MEEYSYNSIMGGFSKEEILYTYRKVKRELFYEKEHISLEQIVQFEENLNENVDSILMFLKKDSINNLDTIFKDKLNIGYSNFIFKSIKFKDYPVENPKIKIKKTSENYKKGLFEIDDIKFRYLGDVSIFFQIIGGLWISRIGYKIDKHFPENIYGCRLKKFDEESNKPFFEQNHTLYKPYFGDYKKWQNDLFDKINFLKNKDIVVVTSDLKKYYHSIEINLLKKKVDEIIKEFNISLSIQDELLNNLLFGMIDRFNELNNSDYSSFFETNELNPNKFGLPLTLNVSRVLANIYLFDFDKDVIKNVRPIYYGRYVDDIIIAVEYNNDNSNLSLKNVLGSLKKFIISEKNELESKKKGSEFKLQFNSDKENVFLFNNNKDKSELNHLKNIINKNSSEWNLLPDTSVYELNENFDLFQSINSECEEVNSLRKSSGLILKRNKFVKEIINFESDIKNYDAEVWSNRLSNFLNLTLDFIFDLQNFIDLNKYVPRLFGLLIHCKKDEIIKNYFDELANVLFLLEFQTGNNDNPYSREKFLKAKEFIYKKIYENLICSNSLNKVNCLYALELFDFKKDESNNFLNDVIRYFNTDLHSIPYKNCFFKYQEYVDYIVSSIEDKDINYLTDLFFNQELKEFIGDKIHSNKCDCEEEDCFNFCYKIFDATGFYFYTRRISLLELSVAFKNGIISDYGIFSELANKYYHKLNIQSSKDGSIYTFVDFTKSKKSTNPKVCNTHFLTKDESFDAMVRQLTEPDKKRFDRLNRIVNELIKNSKHIDYVVFHELGLPRHLYVLIAEKLGFVGINLISGLEYKIDTKKKEADSQLCYVLKVDNDTGGSIALYQSKKIGAIHENSELFNKANLKISPAFKEKFIIKHNDFIFSGMICNDLLDINNRSSLRGNIDALFVVAWNSDLETYQHLVKSASLDIHCFVSLCNNKQYGDTRIRAPYKEEWKRDMQKIHGGELDNFMISKLPIYELRDYQTYNVPPSKPFKPFPTGFVISEERKFK